MESKDLFIRDPYVIKEKGLYYLFGTTDKNCWNGKAESFCYYKSRDLNEWGGPYVAFKPDSSFWADENFWAPEVHKINGSFYMIASFKKKGRCRGSQILKSDTVEGPYVPISKYPFTPSDWECLDATLYVEDDIPWAVFSHEWVQIQDGEFCKVQLSTDLSKTIGKPQTILKASDAKWTVPLADTNKNNNYVTDGCYFYKCSNGTLILLWSSFSKSGYTIGQSISYNGIKGPFLHKNELIFAQNGGHGMIFKSYQGQLILTIHKPNLNTLERPVFFEIVENGDILTLGKQIYKV